MAVIPELTLPSPLVILGCVVRYLSTRVQVLRRSKKTARIQKSSPFETHSQERTFRFFAQFLRPSMGYLRVYDQMQHLSPLQEPYQASTIFALSSPELTRLEYAPTCSSRVRVCSGWPTDLVLPVFRRLGGSLVN